MTRLFSSILLVSAFSLPCTLAAQQTANLQLVPTPSTTSPSAILRPAIDSIQQALTILRPQKWKVSGDTAQQTEANLSSIQNDLQTTLPPLLAAADQHPGSVVQVMPAYRNIEALYDVLLRVSQVANLSAPSLQIGALQEAMDRLERGRRELGNRLESAALQQEQQANDLQAQLHTLQSAPQPAPCPPPPAPVKKHKPQARPAHKPAAAPATAPPANAPAATH